MLDLQLMGMETEYSSFDPTTNKEEAELLLNSTSQLYLGFLPNGGRLYVDVGNHLEYGTPECSDPLEATIYHHAGDRIVLRAAKQARKPIYVYRINEAPSESDRSKNVTFGCHENYLITQRHREAIYREMLPFLVSRTILTGSGSLHQGEFRISQRARYIERVRGSDTTSQRPIINTREEGGLDSDIYERFHLITGDANVSPWATMLKVGATSLVIALTEQGVELGNDSYSNPIKALRALNDATPLNTTIARNQYWEEALDIQARYLSLVVMYGKKGLLPKWYDTITRLWELALAGINGDWQKLVGILDWPTKCHILIQAAHDGYKYNSSEMDWIATQYHHIDPDESLYEAVRLDQSVGLPYTAKELKAATANATSYSRAIERAKAVRGKRATYIDWDEIRYHDTSKILPL